MRNSRALPLVTAAVAAALGFSTSAAIQQQPSTKTPTGNPTALRFARAWDGTRVIQNAVVVVSADRIVSVGSGEASVPRGADVVDLRPLTALPGLIDAHTHMTYGWDGAPGTTPLKQGQRTPAERLELATVNARKTLETGVTTVRDLGAGGGLDITLRDDIAAGRTIGPRMFVSGQGISAGRGGGAPDPAAMQKTTEARLTTTADWVKVYASRGSYQSVDTTQTIFFDELKAIVDTAHAKGRKVAVHSYGPSGVKDAVRAGADTIEHGIELDAETIAEMVKRRTIWVPTVDHNRYYVDAKDEFQFAPETIAPLQAYIEKNLDAVRRAAKAGVRLAMGSDAVYSMFGQNTRELGWFIKAGLTPEQALRTATTTGAEMLGAEDRLGRLAPGYLADIIAVDGNPLQKIDTLFAGVRWVMQNGAVVVDRRK